jgi:hypothetical protein
LALGGSIADGDRDTYWTTDDWTTAATVEFDLGKSCTFNVAELAEHINGQQSPDLPSTWERLEIRPRHDSRLQAAGPLTA